MKHVGHNSPPECGHPPLVHSAVHGGIDRAELLARGLDAGQIIDFSANQSPLGASPTVRSAVKRVVLDAYPDRDAGGFARLAAARHGLFPEQVVVGNGSTELIRLLAQVLLDPGDTALSLGPSFGEYMVATALARAGFVEHRLLLGEGGFTYDHASFSKALARSRPRLCWLCSPNNPTGLALSAADVEELVSGFPETMFVLDEAYADLLERPQWTVSSLARGNLVVLRSLTKTWGLAGLRLGYLLADESLAASLHAAKPPWNVNACAQAAGEVALEDAAGHEKALRLLAGGKEQLTSGLRTGGWKVLPSAAGFFLVEVGDASWAREGLLRHGCLVRDCTSFDLPQYVRVGPRLPGQNRLLLAAFAALSAGRGRGGT